MADAWSSIDALLLEGQRTQAVQAVRARFGCSLPETVEVLGERFETLRRTRPGDFTVSLDGYWDNFYS